MKIPSLHSLSPAAPVNRQSLAINQTVSGKMLGQLKSGEIIVNLAGHHYRGRIMGKMLTPGQTALFRVDQASPRLELSVIQSSVKAENPDIQTGKNGPGIFSGQITNPGTALQTLLFTGNINAWPATSPLLQVLVQKIRDRTHQGGGSGGAVRQLFLHSGLFFDAASYSGSCQTIDANYHPHQDLKLLLYLLSRESGIISRAFNTLASGDTNKAYKLHSLGQYSNNAYAVPGQLLAGSHGLLACLVQENLERILDNQVKSLDAHRRGDSLWYFDLPATIGSEHVSIPVTIQQEEAEAGRHSNRQLKTWRVDFAIESLELGLIKAEIRVRQSHVNAVIQADRRFTVSLLESNFHQLEDKFAMAGLELSLKIFELVSENGKDDYA